MATDVLRSSSPDIELGTHISHSGLLISFAIFAIFPFRHTVLICHLAPGSPQSSLVPGPSSRLPTYSSYDPALQHAQPQSTPSRPASPLPPTTLETDPSITFTHPVEGNYGDPSDRLFSIYLAQAGKFDKEQSESWKGDTEGILVFVRFASPEPTLTHPAHFGIDYLRQVCSLLR